MTNPSLSGRGKSQKIDSPIAAPAGAGVNGARIMLTIGVAFKAAPGLQQIRAIGQHSIGHERFRKNPPTANRH